ncbi:MAG: CoB--CoM heterodisulfide reductase subunit C [Methanobacteriaceae archaeon]|nr:CoB--CoM heterodisulfide reductase subunit C [Methanobacteriaceae archaeon]
MSMLQRLKKIFTGKEEEPETEKKDKSKESTDKTETETKTEQKTTAEDTKTDKIEPKPTNADEAKAEEKEVKKESEKKAEPETPPKTEEKEEKPKTERSVSMSLLDRADNILKPEDIDKEFSQQIKDAGAESLELCFQCGTCTGSCPSGRRTPYRIRQIVRKSLVGLKEEVISSDELWMCTTCYACQERCPREIKIVDIVKLARNEAAKAGYMGQAHKMVGSFVIKTGHGVPINDATMELRKQVGLDELPPTTHQFPGALEEVQKITKATGFDSLIGYNPETGELE